MSNILSFFNVVRRHWGSLVTSGALIGALGIWQGARHPVKPWVYWAIAVVGLVTAFYYAWRDEKKKYEDEKAKFGHPNFKFNLEQMFFDYNNEKNLTIIVLGGYLLNAGDPSVVHGWHGTYTAENHPEMMEPYHIHDTAWIFVHGAKLIFTDKNVLSAQTVTSPVLKGDARTGYLIFSIDGDRMEELRKGNYQIKVGAHDYEGTPVEAMFVPRSEPMKTLKTYPGDRVEPIETKLLEGSSESEPEKPQLTDFVAEWKELAARFGMLDRFVSASWHCTRRNNATVNEKWDVGGISGGAKCETLCRYAGSLLLKSPKASSLLPDNIRAYSNPVWRWLFFLKENHRAMESEIPLMGTESDGTKTIYLMGSIRALPAVSERICLECAAAELGD
jgi:hypothetical protein